MLTWNLIQPNCCVEVNNSLKRRRQIGNYLKFCWSLKSKLLWFENKHTHTHFNHILLKFQTSSHSSIEIFFKCYFLASHGQSWPGERAWRNTRWTKKKRTHLFNSQGHTDAFDWMWIDFKVKIISFFECDFLISCDETDDGRLTGILNEWNKP